VEEVWLHSHDHRYPLHHDDGKVSSQGQQVTGFVDSDEEMDPNNIWIFYPPESEPDGRVALKNGDIVRLYHPATKKFLLTHDVASPLTMTNQEVTVLEWSDEKRRKEMLWTVQVTQNTSNAGNLVKSMSTQFKLVHVPTKVHLNNHQLPLPKWGFDQREINGCKRGHKESSKWTISTIIDGMTPEEEKERSERKVPKISFVDKFLELQGSMLKTNSRLADDHPYKSTPGTWPFVRRGIAFWDKTKKARIYLLGNPIGWYTALFGTLALVASLAKEAFLWRRGQSSRAEAMTFRYFKKGGFLLMAYALHYFPFFTMTRSLYLHHYLPAFMISCMVTGVLFDHGMQTDSKRSILPASLKLVACAISILVIGTFVYFSPLTFGTDIATDDLVAKKWVSTWDWP
jgi:dolichyl-phosphate-mannose-protein mannosyltransferase